MKLLINGLPLEIISNDKYYHRQQSRRVHHHLNLYYYVAIQVRYFFETFHVVDAMLIDFVLVLNILVSQYSNE